MLLALDIGNSAVKVGLFEGDELAHVESFPPPNGASSTTEANPWHDALSPFFENTTIRRIGLASVVPPRTETVTNALQTLTSAPITPVHPEMNLPFELAYDTPDTLGNDRLAAAAAGWVHYGRDESQSVVVVDAGTAINYEVIQQDGIYRGGAIGTGPSLMHRALRAGTAQLPDVPLTIPKTPVGHSTQTALQSGIMWGLVDSVRGMTDRLGHSLSTPPALVFTGGWSALLVDHFPDDVHHAPYLVLRGVRLLTRRSR